MLLHENAISVPLNLDDKSYHCLTKEPIVYEEKVVKEIQDYIKHASKFDLFTILFELADKRQWRADSFAEGSFQ